MYSFDFNTTDIEKLIIYGDGKKYLEKTIDINLIRKLINGKPCASRDKIVRIHLEKEVKRARKENLDRNDNYTISYKMRFEHRTTVYIHISEVEFEDLGEYVVSEHNGEKNYKHIYRVRFKHGAEGMFYHAERITVPKGWTIPREEIARGAQWSETYNIAAPTYQPITNPQERLREECTLVKRYVDFGPVEETCYASDFCRIEKDEARIEREKIAEVMNMALGDHRISHFDIERMLKVLNITIK